MNDRYTPPEVGHEGFVVVVDTFGIAYNARIVSASGHYHKGRIGGPSVIQGAQLPEELQDEIEELIIAEERRRWGLVEDAEVVTDEPTEGEHDALAA